MSGYNLDYSTLKVDATDPLQVLDWDSYKGQSRLKVELNVRIESAVQRSQPLDHVLLMAPPGMGKTTLAHVIASKLNQKLHLCPSPFVEWRLHEKIEDNMSDKDVLFLDEVHQIAQKRGQVEALLPILLNGETRYGDRLRPVTIIAATTEPDKLPQAFIDRFPIQPYFEPYTISEMTEILREMFIRLGVRPYESDLYNLAKAANNIPRHAANLARAARDLTVTTGQVPTASEVLQFCAIRPDGLTRDHERYVDTLYRLFGRQTPYGKLYQSGIANLARALDLKRESVERLERSLIKKGMIELSGTGRALTKKGIALAKEVEGKYS